MKERKKTIDILTERGEYVTTVKGVIEAASFCKVTQPAVSQHLHGMNKTCGGFILRERNE